MRLTIAHPAGHLELPAAIALLGGPALYLLGNVFFKRASAKYYPLSHLAGLGMLALVAPFALLMTPLALGTATTVVLITVAVWETRSFASRREACRGGALPMKSMLGVSWLAAALLMNAGPAHSATPAVPIDATAAGRFAALALKCVHQEYPNKISHTLAGDADVRPPRELFPAFHGCYDWHSAVHGHWLLVRLVRQFPNAAFAPAARAALAQSLTRENIAGEVAYLQGAGRASFERPYGLAWLLQLSAELRSWKDSQAQEWARNLVPLESEAAARIKRWLPDLYYPIRVGEHDQTAFSFGLIWDWARSGGRCGDAQRCSRMQRAVSTPPTATAR